MILLHLHTAPFQVKPHAKNIRGVIPKVFSERNYCREQWFLLSNPGGSCRSSIQFWQATNFNTIFDILIGPDRTRCVCVCLSLSLSLSRCLCVCVISGSDHHFCKGLGFLLHDHPKTFPLLESRISILDFKARWKPASLITWPPGHHFLFESVGEYPNFCWVQWLSFITKNTPWVHIQS